MNTQVFRAVLLAGMWFFGWLAPTALAAPGTEPEPGRPTFTLFESGPVRPLSLSPSGKTLFVCNIPDNRVEIFAVTARGLVHRGSVPVGLEPVAVAARSDQEAWVVNHLSDSVSIVRLDSPARGSGSRVVGRVVQTLLVGDEPRDIVFGGRNHSRAFITTAHRGQNVPYDPELTVAGRDRADVWVFDAGKTGRDTLGGSVLTILTLFTDTPRALAVSPDGTRIYAAGFQTGNRTTALFEGVVPDDPNAPDNPQRLVLPLPRVNHAGIQQPQTGLIVKFDGAHWVDEDGKVWDDHVRFSLPDRDVFAIDADANPPRLLDGPAGVFTGVGTVLFNMVVNPKSGRVYVSNTDARNEVRFEGAGSFLQTFGKKSVRGHLAESRITVLGGTPRVKPIHLNKHIDYDRCCAAVTSAENARSVSTPLDMAITRSGATLYVAAFGTSEVAVYDTEALEKDAFVPSVKAQIRVSGGGPSGLALHEKLGRLYVFTRFDNAVSVIDTRSRREIDHVRMFNPEPASVVRGRRFLYDASLTSSHGDSSCSSCHIFGDLDSLAWDLGDPDGDPIDNGPADPVPGNPLGNNLFAIAPERVGVSSKFQPMKGPMTTQSLRGMANHGAMHWRGDRLRNTDRSAQPDSGVFDEVTAFEKFNVAFEGLNGRHEPLPDEDMRAFTEFALQITYPPNPIRNLDDSLTPDQEAGRLAYFGAQSDVVGNCNSCHVLDPEGNAEFGVAAPGFFGTDGRFTVEPEPQIFKIAHFRNLYQKIGMFGMAPAASSVLDGSVTGEGNEHTGDQIRGYGFLHDGAIDTINRFMSQKAFVRRPGVPGGFELSPAGNAARRQLEQFLLAFDSNLKPIVGQQLTLTEFNRDAAAPRLALLKSRAEAGDCDLIAKSGRRGYLYVGAGQFMRDTERRSLLPDEVLRTLARVPRAEVTYTCVPVGAGVRMGLDRDEDGVLDRDE